MSFTITYGWEVFKKDKPKLSASVLKQVQHAVETKLLVQPEKFGKPLRNSLKSYRSLRVGDYRMIFNIQGSTIKVLAIAHRSISYKIALVRLFSN